MYLNIIRSIIILLTNHTITVILWTKFMKRAKSLLPLCSYLFVKCVILNIGLSIVIRVYHANWYEQSKELQFIYTFTTWAFAMLTFVVLKWTFDVSTEKMMLMSFLGDCLSASIGSAGMFFTNFLLGIELGFAQEVVLPFQFGDLMIPVFSMGLLFLMLHILRPWVERLRNYEVKHKKIVMVIIIICIVLITQPLIVFAYNDGRNGITICGFLFIILLFSVTLLNKQARMLKNEQKVLDFQTNIMKNYYIGLKHKEEELLHNRKLLSNQMKTLSLEKQEITDNQIISCLEELQKGYLTLEIGLYCDDPILDGVITTEAEIMKNKYITFDCSLQNYHSDTKEQKVMSSLILYLLDFGICTNQKLDADKNVFLRISNIKNQVMITYKTSVWKKEQLSKRTIKMIIGDLKSVIIMKHENLELKADILIEKK